MRIAFFVLFAGLLGGAMLPVARGQTVISVASSPGAHHSLFLKSDGSVWAMGQNQTGQLGDGTYINQTNRPERIVASGVATIAAGDFNSLFIKNDGSLWVVGYNEQGELGDGIRGSGR